MFFGHIEFNEDVFLSCTVCFDSYAFETLFLSLDSMFDGQPSRWVGGWVGELSSRSQVTSIISYFQYPIKEYSRLIDQLFKLGVIHTD